MSRRAPLNAAQERAAQNQQTIKTLLKIETNKSCADCKRNKHPRWASWNLGVFVCIRCSGIHRGMGTHISRVKSVDLDAWTDEQLQSILRWGNARANKYWESKLAEGHIPSEAKIENFIRTKYESKRWAMDGPMPDPASLDTEGDDDVPLNVVQEKAKLDRASSQRTASTTSQPVAPPPKPTPPIDLFGDVPDPPARPSTTDTPGSRPPPNKSAGAAKPTKASDSLLGLDFFGGPSSSTANRPASATSTSGGGNIPSRPDLKQSILSLYASAPKPQPTLQHDRQGSFGGMQSPPTQPQSSFGGLDDAFGGLNVSSSTSPPAPKPAPPVTSDPFGDFSKTSAQRPSMMAPQVTSPLSGGSFFDTGPKPAAKASAPPKSAAKPQAVISPLDTNDFGDFSFASSPSQTTTKPAAPKVSNDLFDMDEPTPAPVPNRPAEPSVNQHLDSPFNLSVKPSAPLPVSKEATAPKSNPSINYSAFSNADAWGSNDPWSNKDTTVPEPSKPIHSSAVKAPAITMQNDFSAWAGTETVNSQPSQSDNQFSKPSQVPPKVTADEDFGGWSSPNVAASSSTMTPASQPKPTGGGFGGDDLYSNVWE